MNAERYSYRVMWSEEDGEFVGLCAEFPGLSWLASDQAGALAGVVGLVKGVLDDMHANDETPPVPVQMRRYSGRFVVRIPPERHRLLALQAAESGISLNRLVSDRLSA